MRRFTILVLGVLAVSCGLARAQLVLPGSPVANPPAASPPAPVPPGAVAPAATPSARKTERLTADFVSPTSAVAGRTLRLNGAQGQLILSGRGKDLRIDKLSLAGEVISEPARKCLIDIVGDAPIETRSLGRPDGLERYEAQVPACVFTFDVLEGAVLVPAQGAACVFQAADCQASPGGLWGPDASAPADDSKALARQRSRAEAAAGRALHAIQARLKGRPEADDVVHEDGDWAAHQEDICRGYAQEALSGFCASRMAQARAALLRARFDALDRKPPAQD
jgi:hypothetical protein